MTEETFGPTLPIMKVSSVEEAVRLANDSQYGLSASVFSKDVERAKAVALQLDCGAVNVNDVISNLMCTTAPMGGWKASGIGARFGGVDGVRKFCKQETVVVPRTNVGAGGSYYNNSEKALTRMNKLMTKLALRSSAPYGQVTGTAADGWQPARPDVSKMSSLPVIRCPQTTTTELGTITGKVDTAILGANACEPSGVGGDGPVRNLAADGEHVGPLTVHHRRAVDRHHGVVVVAGIRVDVVLLEACRAVECEHLVPRAVLTDRRSSGGPEHADRQCPVVAGRVGPSTAGRVVADTYRVTWAAVVGDTRRGAGRARSGSSPPRRLRRPAPSRPRTWSEQHVP